MNVATPLSMLSLCSGIGGLDLGACRAIGGRVVAYCERDPYAASVLLARMEDEALEPAPVWVGDLRELDAEPLAGVDVVCAGYPCQPFSTAGNRQGEDDERHLWPEVLRIIRVVRPRYVCLENVAGHVSMGLDRVLGDLAELGFDAEWSVLRAADVGAPHQRRRVFVLAYAALLLGYGGDGQPGSEEPEPGDGSGSARAQWAVDPSGGRVADGVPSRVDRLRCLGNAVVPEQAEVAFRSLLHRASAPSPDEGGLR